MRLIALLFVILSMSACDMKEGSGNIVSENRNTGNFDGIRVGGNFDVQVSKGNAHSVRIDADDNLIRNIETEVRNGVLVIKSTDHSLRNAHFKAMITTPELNKIDASASAHVKVNGSFSANNEANYEASSGATIIADINSPEVTTNASSSGRIVLTGKTRKIKANASSGGEVDARNLLAETSDVESSSGASVKIYASVAVDANASSGGSITHRGGAASVKKSVSSGGSVSAGQ